MIIKNRTTYFELQLNEKMKKTLELTLCESEGVKIEVSCDVERTEKEDSSIHPDANYKSTITEYCCKDIRLVIFNGLDIWADSFYPNNEKLFIIEIKRLVESQLESNPELFEE